MTWWAIDVRAAPEERERLGAWLVARTGQAVEERDDGTLVTFAPDAHWSLLDHIGIERELTDLLGRKVDLVSRRGVEQSQNRSRRREILESARPICVTG